MDAIKILRVYNLVNPKGIRLQLRLGHTPKPNDQRHIHAEDKGYRWCFDGSHITMPVQSGYWFNGFPVDTMLLWLAEHEWYVETEVNMLTGKAKVHSLPEPAEEYEERQLIADEQVFYGMVRELLCDNNLDKALQIVRYVYEVGPRTAMEIIKNISINA